MILYIVYSEQGTHWAPTQAEARVEKQRLVGTGVKRGEITVQQVSVPTTSRATLAEWLNDKEVKA